MPRKDPDRGITEQNYPNGQYDPARQQIGIWVISVFKNVDDAGKILPFGNYWQYWGLKLFPRLLQSSNKGDKETDAGGQEGTTDSCLCHGAAGVALVTYAGHLHLDWCLHVDLWKQHPHEW